MDASRTVDTGSLDAKRATEFGFETAFAYDALYTQGGWYHYDIERRTALPNPDFTGWYALATWSLTGEQRAYDPATATFRQLRPSKPLGSPGGFGAFELKARCEQHRSGLFAAFWPRPRAVSPAASRMSGPWV